MTDSMPDAKRKLPVLYGIRNELEVAVDLKPYGVHLQMVRENESDVEYQPAVPRCRTCPHFAKDWDEDLPDPWYYCPHIEHDDLPPQDGSGYCYMHPEARHG